MVHMFALIGRHILNRGMDSFSIVEARNIFKYAFASLLTCLELFQIDQLFFDHAVEGFDTCIIIAISFSAHAAIHSVGLQTSLIVMRSVLTAAIRMM